MKILKKCSVCNEHKELDCFHKETRRKDGLSIRCKICQSKKSKKYRDLNNKQITKQKADWYHKNQNSILTVRKLQRRSNPKIQMIALAKYRAKRDNLPFNIELSDIHIPEYCPVLNIKLEVSTKEATDYSPSLDKIDPQLGYTKGNIQVISRLANLMKNSATLEQLVLFSEWVDKFIKPFMESKNNE